MSSLLCLLGTQHLGVIYMVPMGHLYQQLMTWTWLPDLLNWR